MYIHKYVADFGIVYIPTYIKYLGNYIYQMLYDFILRFQVRSGALLVLLATQP